MKRTILPSTGAAVGWWANNPTAHKADCFVITLPTGQTIYATEGQWDILIPAGLSPTGSAVTFRASRLGVWSRGKITSEAGFKCTANNMQLTVLPNGGTYPGLDISIPNAAFNRLFEGSHVWVWTAYMPFGEFGNVQVVEPKFQGWILRASAPGRVKCEFDCGDPMFLLNQKVPSRLFQSSCFKSFGDSNCGLNPANYTVSFTAAASTQYALTPVSAFTQPDGYFTQGVVTCLTGANAGLSQTVKAHTGGVISVMAPWLLPIGAGDTFSVIKGCDQTPATCAGMKRTDGTLEPDVWSQRFGGTPFMPPPSTSI